MTFDNLNSDHVDGSGVLVHDYGPHIFHTDDGPAYGFLSRFASWNGYRHAVLADVPDGDGRKLVPVPFDLSSLEEAFGPEEGARLAAKLAAAHPGRASVPVSELASDPDPDVAGVGRYVYEHIFRHYTAKQWGTDPATVDPSVTARVPVRLDRAGGYFRDAYQGLPVGGYAAMFGRMLRHPGIAVETGTDALSRLALSDGATYFDGGRFDGIVVYTGQVDRLFRYAHGELPYRSLEFRFRAYDEDYVLPCGTVNYTMDRDMTRATEFKRLTGQILPGRTVICEEYPKDYAAGSGGVPCSPVKGGHSDAMYGKYAAEAARYRNLYLLGRLARYSYLDMDDAVMAAMALAERVLGRA